MNPPTTFVQQSPRGPRNHDGTISPASIDAMWETGMTAAFTVDYGLAASRDDLANV